MNCLYRDERGPQEWGCRLILTLVSAYCVASLYATVNRLSRVLNRPEAGRLLDWRGRPTCVPVDHQYSG